MHPKLAAGLDSAWRSFKFTAASIGVAFITSAAAASITVNSVTASGISDPAHFWAFTQTNWFPFALGQVIAPLLRGINAAAKA